MSSGKPIATASYVGASAAAAALLHGYRPSIVRIPFANQPRSVFGGSETYLVTIGCELERLGHEVEIYAPAVGDVARLGRGAAHGCTVEPSELPDDPRLVLGQDGASCAEMAARYPDAVRIYVSHATWYLPFVPPQVHYHAIVTMNATPPAGECARPPAEVVRLRQPVDVERFRGRGSPELRGACCCSETTGSPARATTGSWPKRARAWGSGSTTSAARGRARPAGSRSPAPTPSSGSGGASSGDGLAARRVRVRGCRRRLGDARQLRGRRGPRVRGGAGPGRRSTSSVCARTWAIRRRDGTPVATSSSPATPRGGTSAS